MKTHRNILWMAFGAIAFVSCKENNPELEIPSAPPSASDIVYEVYSDDEDENLIHFKFDNADISPLWTFQTSPGGTTITSVERSFTRRFITAGIYEGTIQAYNVAGTCDPVAFSFTIPEGLDPRIELLTGGATPKTWVWDKLTDGHMGEGSLDTYAPNWWIVGANELDGHDMYDDGLRFGSDYSYELNANGFVYVESQAVAAMGGQAEGKAGQVVAYTQPAGQTWELKEKGDKLYLVFSANTFPSYLCNTSALANPEYEVLELSAEKLSLRYVNQDIDAWYYNFIPAGDEPDPEPEPDVAVVKLDEATISTVEDLEMWESPKSGAITAADGSVWAYNSIEHSTEFLSGYLIVYTGQVPASQLTTPTVSGRIIKISMSSRMDSQDYYDGASTVEIWDATGTSNLWSGNTIGGMTPTPHTFTTPTDSDHRSFIIKTSGYEYTYITDIEVTYEE